MRTTKVILCQQVEFKAITGHPNNVYETLNRKISAYKAKFPVLKVGITGRSPQKRFDEHSRSFTWDRMIVIYKTRSINYANTLEYWLVEKHRNDLINKREGGGSNLTEQGYNYVYLLLGRENA